MMAKKKGWWNQPVFSSPKARNTKPAATKPAAKPKIEKCLCGSGKSKLVCEHKTPTPRGRAKPAAAKEPETRHGVQLCGCGSYLFPNGTCRNIQCSGHQRNQ